MSLPVLSRQWRWRTGSRRARLLAVTASYFAENARWPSLFDVQKRLVECFDLSKAAKLVRRMPKSLGYLDSTEHLTLSIKGLHRANPNNPILEAFETVLVWLSEIYLSRERGTTFSENELVEALSLSQVEAEQVMLLLVAEDLVAKQGEGRGVTITPKMVPFLYVSDLREFLRTKQQQDLRRALGRVATFPMGVISWLRGPETSVATKIAVGVLATLIAALLGALIISETIQEDHEAASRRSEAARSGG